MRFDKIRRASQGEAKGEKKGRTAIVQENVTGKRINRSMRHATRWIYTRFRAKVSESTRNEEKRGEARRNEEIRALESDLDAKDGDTTRLTMGKA
jgi:hypothetical protein